MWKENLRSPWFFSCYFSGLFRNFQILDNFQVCLKNHTVLHHISVKSHIEEKLCMLVAKENNVIAMVTNSHLSSLNHIFGK